MNWLIVEDALRDTNGHWFEYLENFYQELKRLGDQVTVLVTLEAAPSILETLPAQPVLPPSVWHRNNQRKSFGQKLLSLLSHGWKTRLAILSWLSKNPKPDIIFVPTVATQHLLAWTFLIQYSSSLAHSQVLLFFPNLPIRKTDKGECLWIKSSHTTIMRFLFRRLSSAVRSGKVILGVETDEMRSSLSSLTNLPVRYFPHPVALPRTPLSPGGNFIRAGCFGAARHEKGSDLLQEAIRLTLEQNPDLPASFTFQWLDDFNDDSGKRVSLAPSLKGHARVKVISRFFQTGEYNGMLSSTDLMILPYRKSSYDLRVSRVAIEAMTRGIPLVVTGQTTLATQGEQFGQVLAFADGNSGQLKEAIHKAILEIENLRSKARPKSIAAQKHFSVENFRTILLQGKSGIHGVSEARSPAALP